MVWDICSAYLLCTDFLHRRSSWLGYQRVVPYFKQSRGKLQKRRRGCDSCWDLTSKGSHRIHVWYIYLHFLVDFYGFHAGKYRLIHGSFGVDYGFTTLQTG